MHSGSLLLLTGLLLPNTALLYPTTVKTRDLPVEGSLPLAGKPTRRCWRGGEGVMHLSAPSRDAPRCGVAAAVLLLKVIFDEAKSVSGISVE